MGIVDLGNMSKVGEVPDDGAYVVTITKADDRKSQDGKSTNIFLTWYVEAVHETGDDSWVGEEFDTLVNVQKSTLRMVKPLFRAAIPGRNFDGENEQLDTGDLMGAKLIIEGKKGEYNGQAQFQISAYYPYDADPFS